MSRIFVPELRYPGYRRFGRTGRIPGQSDGYLGPGLQGLGQAPSLRAPGESLPIPAQQSVVALRSVPTQPYRLGRVGYLVHCIDSKPQPTYGPEPSGGGPISSAAAAGGPTVVQPPQRLTEPSGDRIFQTDFLPAQGPAPAISLAQSGIRIERRDGQTRVVFESGKRTFWDDLTDWLQRDSIVQNVQNKWIVGGAFLAWLFVRRR